MKNKGYITAIMLVSVLIATFIVRIFFIQNILRMSLRRMIEKHPQSL